MYPIISSLFILISILFSQDITSIEITGNKKTKDAIILREIKQEINTPWSIDSIVQDKNKIYNLGLFSSVDIKVVNNTEDQNIYMITVSEMWYLWPVPIIEYDNRSEEFNYGGALIHNNFRGENSNITIGGKLGNTKEYFAWYENPWISGNHNSIEVGIYNESIDHFIYNIAEKEKGFFLLGGFYNGVDHKFNFGLHYENKMIEELLDSNKAILDPIYFSQTNFHYLDLGYRYKYDTRDIYIDPNRGVSFNFEFNNAFGFNNTDDISDIEIEFNIYKMILKNYFNPVFNYRFLANIQYSKSDLPIFRKKYIGGQGYVRGYSAIPLNNLISNSRGLIEVDNFFINTFQIQSTLLERKEYIEKVEMGIDFLFFADWGLGYNFKDINKLNINNSLFGYGFGLRIFIMGGVIDLDYGINHHGTSMFHLF